MEKSKAINNLMDEHAAILFTLKVLIKLERLGENHTAIERSDIEKLVDFLKVFADQCHHGKEEQYLFETGIIASEELSTLNAILADHKQARHYILQMEEALSYATEERIILPLAFRQAAKNYIALLHEHIIVENEQFFPILTRSLSIDQDNELFQKFAQFEAEVIGEGVHEYYHQLLDYFDNKYIEA